MPQASLTEPGCKPAGCIYSHEPGPGPAESNGSLSILPRSPEHRSSPLHFTSGNRQRGERTCPQSSSTDDPAGPPGSVFREPTHHLSLFHVSRGTSWISWKNSSVASKTGVKPPARKTLKTGITRNPLASWPLPAGHCSVGQACQAPPQGWNGSFQQDSRACLGQAVAEGEPSHSGSIVKEDATEGGWRPRGDGGCLCP